MMAMFRHLLLLNVCQYERRNKKPRPSLAGFVVGVSKECYVRITTHNPPLAVVVVVAVIDGV
jgi:hypothetical protein